MLYVFPEFAIVGNEGIKGTATVKIYENGKVIESFKYNRGDDPRELIQYLEKAKKVEIFIEIPGIYCREGASNGLIKNVFRNTIPKQQELRIYL